MKRSVLKKLNERKGITLVFALLALLVVTLLSTTLISASLTSAHRLNDDKYSKQSDIALDCAANLIKTELCNARYYTFDDASPSGGQDSHGGQSTAVPEGYTEGLLGSTLRDLCIGSDFYKTIPYEVKASSMPAVSVVIEKRVKNNVGGTSDTFFYATLRAEDKGTASNNRSMILEFLYGNLAKPVEIDSKSYIETLHYCTFSQAKKETR